MIGNSEEAKRHFHKHGIRTKCEFIAVLPDGHIYMGDKDQAKKWPAEALFIKGENVSPRKKKTTE